MFSRWIGNESGKHGAEWEVRPGGMVVQKRHSDLDPSPDSVSTINAKVKCGELKKTLAQPSGLHHQDQNLIVKKKERDSKEYLDLAGVKEGSKMSLVDDIVSKEKKNMEMLKNANTNTTAKSLSVISRDIDKLEQQLGAMEGAASRGRKVAVTEIENLTENLMTKLIKLDEVVAEGDLKLERRVQVRRVQKHMETLDCLKLQQKEHSSRQKSHMLLKQRVAEPRPGASRMQKKPGFEKTPSHVESIEVQQIGKPLIKLRRINPASKA